VEEEWGFLPVVGRRGSTIKITSNKELAFISNRTLTAVKANADELYPKLGEGNELFEKIRHYFVLNHYLQKVSSSHRNTRQQYIDLYVWLGGQRFEIEEYANAIYIPSNIQIRSRLLTTTCSSSGRLERFSKMRCPLMGKTMRH
jgi:hypothetical protein